MASKKTHDPLVGKPLVSVGVANIRRRLALCLEPLGFEEDRRSLAQAAFKKEEGGRTIHFSCSARTSNQFVGVENISFRRYQGLVLSIRLSTPLKTRLIIAPPSNRFLNRILSRRKRKLGLRPMPSLGQNLDSYEISAVDEAWARQFLGNSQVLEIMQFWVEEAIDSPAVVFTPEVMAITLGPALKDLEPPIVQKWIGSALDLITLAEAIPTTVAVEMTKHELALKENPRAAVIKLVAKLFAMAIGALFLLGLLLFIAGPKVGVIFLLLFMPFAFLMAAWRFFRAVLRKSP